VEVVAELLKLEANVDAATKVSPTLHLLLLCCCWPTLLGHM
jgi:hypothetical protein